MPEIQRSDLAQVVLTMKKVGIRNVEDFDFVDSPGGKTVIQAINTLKTLGALDDRENLTEIGEVMVDLGLEPRLGRMVIEAFHRGCVEEICVIAAFLGGKNIYSRPFGFEEEAERAHSKFKDRDSDFFTYLNIWNAYAKSGFSDEWAKRNYFNERAMEEVKNVRLDLRDVLDRHGIYLDENPRMKFDREQIGKSVTAGFVGNIIEQSGKFSYRKLDGSKEEIFVQF